MYETLKMQEQFPDRRTVVHENESLKQKILQIEMQNVAQQRRLQQLEKMVMELSRMKSPKDVLDTPHMTPFREPTEEGSRTERAQEGRVRDTSPGPRGREGAGVGSEDDHADGGMSDIVANLMDEFDRTARESGLIYGMTPTRSTADSEDQCDDFAQGCQGTEGPREPDVHSATEDGCDVSPSPLSVFLTPLYKQSVSSKDEKGISDEPLETPRLSLTTPVLLTVDALKEMERSQNTCQEPFQREENVFASLCSHSQSSKVSPFRSRDILPSKACPAFSAVIGSKTSPFANLLRGLHHVANKNPSGSSNPGDAHLLQASRKAQPTRMQRLPLRSQIPGSPSSITSSITGHVFKWSQSLTLPLLSPLPESHCGDIQAQASDEEDLVVDEVVSLSMVGKGRRQRSESLCSVSGPCVPPDLLLNTCKDENLDSIQVKEEDVLTEIAGVFDDSTLLADQLIEAEFSQEELNQLVKEEVVSDSILLPKDTSSTVMQDDDHLQYLNILQNETSTISENSALSSSHMESNNAEDVSIKPVEVKLPVPAEVPLKGLEKSKSVADLNGLNAQVLSEKVKSVQALQGNRTLSIDGKEVKLPAGSIILAVVNESGSLVPLPQLQVTPQSLTRAVKTESPERGQDEEIDIETVSEKTPVLEAGDLDSLLAQFEASEAVNKTSGEGTKDGPSSAPEQVKATGGSGPHSRGPSVPGIVPLGISPQSSPTHQKIKDALPKEIIEKIKASTKRKSTQMLSEPPVLRKGRGGRQQEGTTNRNKILRTAPQSSSAQTATDERVPPPVDHDYCFSPDKQKLAKQDSSDRMNDEFFNKLPDYYTTMSRRQSKKASICSDDGHDDGGKKDSGVESGDVSDASVETEERKKEGKDGKSRQEVWNNQEKLKGNNDNTDDVYDKIPAYMTDIGNVKPKDDEEMNENEEKDGDNIVITTKPEVKKIKRKTQSLRVPAENKKCTE
ncbi:uncharacterized protein LOC125046585 isoform X2 [Penaeus chinensis]|uniref:uncharacterized protein LOC125046585 isoform X2 n=1 Tax=Penaeus chinensis TaxID=139456 RepID=UPI001FB5BDA4|nr:uncharacterized protein LOC125046585 isoform X2 [Penaeus chinensis]